MYPSQKLAHSALGKKIIMVKTQQFILGTGTAIWWLTEPHKIECLPVSFTFTLGVGNTAPGVIFTTLHILRNLPMGPKS